MAEKKTSGAAKPAQPDEEALAALAGWDCAEEPEFRRRDTYEREAKVITAVCRQFWRKVPPRVGE
jgi:hypothetical protein